MIAWVERHRATVAYVILAVGIASQSPAGWVYQAGIIALLFWGAGRHPVRPS